MTPHGSPDCLLIRYELRSSTVPFSHFRLTPMRSRFPATRRIFFLTQERNLGVRGQVSISSLRVLASSYPSLHTSSFNLHIFFFNPIARKVLLSENTERYILQFKKEISTKSVNLGLPLENNVFKENLKQKEYWLNYVRVVNLFRHF